MQNINSLPDEGFLRLYQIVGDKKRGIPPIIPICRTSFLNGVRSGIYPKPSKALSKRVTVWNVSDIRALIKAVSGDEVQK